MIANETTFHQSSNEGDKSNTSLEWTIKSLDINKMEQFNK